MSTNHTTIAFLFDQKLPKTIWKDSPKELVWCAKYVHVLHFHPKFLSLDATLLAELQQLV